VFAGKPLAKEMVVAVVVILSEIQWMFEFARCSKIFCASSTSNSCQGVGQQWVFKLGQAWTQLRVASEVFQGVCFFLKTDVPLEADPAL